MNSQQKQSFVRKNSGRNAIALLLCLVVLSQGSIANVFAGDPPVDIDNVSKKPEDGLPGRPIVPEEGGRPAKTPEKKPKTGSDGKKTAETPAVKEPYFDNDFDRYNYYLDRTLKTWESMLKSKCIKKDEWLDQKLRVVKILLGVAKDRNGGTLHTSKDGKRAELTGTGMTIDIYGDKTPSIEITTEDGTQIYAHAFGRIMVFRKDKLVARYYCPPKFDVKKSDSSAPGGKETPADKPTGTGKKKDKRTSSLVPFEDNANTRVVNGKPRHSTHVATAQTYLDRGVAYATAAVEEDTSIRFEKPGYAVVATAGVVGDEEQPQTERIPVKPGDTIKSGILLAAQFADGTGFVTRSVPKTPSLLVTVGNQNVYEDDGQQTTKEEIPVTDGNVTMFIGSDRPFANAAIGTRKQSTNADDQYATVLKDGKPVGQVVAFSDLKPAQLADDLRIWTLNDQGQWLREAQLEDALYEASLQVQFDRPVYKVGQGGTLSISNVNNHLKGRALTQAGQADANAATSLRLKPSPNLAGLPQRIPARDSELPFQVTGPGAAQVEVLFESEGQFDATTARTLASPLPNVAAATPRMDTPQRTNNRPRIQVGIGFQFGGGRHHGREHHGREHHGRSRGGHRFETGGGGIRLGF